MASQYLGERYVPQHEGEWDTSKPYDRLSIVSVTNGDNLNAYISRVPVPVGIPITDNNYWALFYISRISGGTGSVSWPDILNKPDTFPPSAHTQGWETITGKPTEFPPSEHNQAISTIQGLQTNLNELQSQIDRISPGGVGSHITTAVFALTERIDVASSVSFIIPFNTLVREANPGPEKWAVTTGGVLTFNNPVQAATYDIYLSGSMFINQFGTSSSSRYFRVILNNSNELMRFYSENTTHAITFPDTYLGSITASTNGNYQLNATFQSGDSFGVDRPNYIRDFITVKAIRRG